MNSLMGDSSDFELGTNLPRETISHQRQDDPSTTQTTGWTWFVLQLHEWMGSEPRGSYRGL